MNSTDASCPINVPGLWHNGDCSLLCRPTKSYDILIFFLGNYLAHVATVTSPPGASVVTQARNMLSAMLFPISGFYLGFEAIASWAIWAETPLQTAAKSGALLMLVKTKTSKQNARRASDVGDDHLEGGRGEQAIELEEREHVRLVSETALVTPRYRPWKDGKIHGHYLLPRGYELRRVPHYTRFKNDYPETVASRGGNWDKFSKRKRTATEIACSYNASKAVVSIAQIVFGIVTLYRTKGNQAEKFGYAAYGLTVTP